MAKSRILHCPSCGAKGRVIVSQPNSIGFVRRYSCDANPLHRWSTIEMRGERSGLARNTEVHPIGWMPVPPAKPIHQVNEDK